MFEPAGRICDQSWMVRCGSLDHVGLVVHGSVKCMDRSRAFDYWGLAMMRERLWIGIHIWSCIMWWFSMSVWVDVSGSAMCWSAKVLGLRWFGRMV